MQGIVQFLVTKIAHFTYMKQILFTCEIWTVHESMQWADCGPALTSKCPHTTFMCLIMVYFETDLAQELSKAENNLTFSPGCLPHSES